MTTLVIATVLIVTLLGIGACFLVKGVRSALSGETRLQELEERRHELREQIRTNGIFMLNLRAKGDPNYLRIEAVVDSLEREYEEVDKEIRQLKVERAERKVLE